MSFSKTTVTAFLGLNSTGAPELINDGEARDICNFRMEKLGKLVSRNGYVIGLFTDIETAALPTRAIPVVSNYAVNGGIVGIGEIILSNKWDVLDTDRMMVYVIRGTKNTSAQTWTDSFSGYSGYDTAGEIPLDVSQRHFECYLFSPITGQYKNTLLTDWDLSASARHANIHTQRLNKAQQMNSDADWIDLYAPNKELPGISGTSGVSDPWIEHYVELSQYRNKLIISDRINGDMFIEDEYERDNRDTCEKNEHELSLRPNCLDEFDIDIVEIERRLGIGEENDAVSGYKTGMALYKYELPKITQKVTVDHAANTIGNEEWLAPMYFQTTINKIRYYINNGDLSTLLMIFNWAFFDGSNPIYTFAAHNINDEKIYTFSNAEMPDEVPSVLGIPELHEEEFENEDGELVKEISSDVYKWHEHELTYYPCNGVSEETGDKEYLLRDIDRIFTKTVPNAPKIERIILKDSPADAAPLGIWRYRMVWDYGDGVYSAPSAEVLCPDIMWSAVKDDMMESEYPGNDYIRPRLYGGIDAFKLQHTRYGGIYDDNNHPYKLNPYNTPELDYNNSEFLSRPHILDGDSNLTNVGEMFYDLKEKFYSGRSHKYGIKEWTGYSGFNGATLKEKGDFTCMATGLFSKSILALRGIVWEGIALAGEYLADWGPLSDELSEKDEFIFNNGSILVPIFQSSSDFLTCNSIFDDNGRLRLSYMNVRPWNGTAYQCMHSHWASFVERPQWQLVLPGYNAYIGCPSNCDFGWMGSYYHSDPASKPHAEIIFESRLKKLGHGGDLYLNLCGVIEDRNNDYDGTIGSDIFQYDCDSGERYGISTTTIDYTADPTRLDGIRPNSILRAVKKENERLTNINASIPAEVIDRLILEGQIEIPLCQNGDDIWFAKTDNIPSAFSDDRRYNTKLMHPDAVRREGEIHGTKVANRVSPPPENRDDKVGELDFPNEATDADPKHVTNLNVYIYGNGERFIGLEQLTSYFPSSLLFKAPRIGLKIPAIDVPSRAKRLLIFRTKASHANDFNPTEFGEVEIVEIKRENGIATTEIPVAGGVSGYNGIYYFDEVRDDNLNFGHTPGLYDGLRKPLKSRFNIPLNERVYYYNFEEETQPQAPRGFKRDGINEGTTAGDVGNISWDAVTVEPDEMENGGFEDTKTLKYKLLYRDVNDIPSQAKVDLIVDVAGTALAPQVVVFRYVPSVYEGSIEKIEMYRSIDGTDYFKIGEIEPMDEGVFVDDNIPEGRKLGCTEPDRQVYESGLRWSEPYRPDWIKGDSFAEYRSGDGDQGTGIESQYGNLLIFKENSMHRVAVQAKSPPLSRTDEVTPEFGSIAPNAVINVNNMAYFLSWKGFMMYDNNVLKKVDGAFAEELSFVIENAGEKIRDASCGYNPYYNEIYLNIPMLETDEDDFDGRQIEHGRKEFYFHKRKLYGHIYIINLDKGYATKFSYTMTTEGYGSDKLYYNNEITQPVQQMRKYFTNSMGELRSGDILPSHYGTIRGATLNNDGFPWAGIYIETPYLIDKAHLPSGTTQMTYTDFDRIFSGRYLNENWTRNGGTFQDIVLGGVTGWSWNSVVFPQTIDIGINEHFASKFFTGDDETLIKRVRKALVNIFTRGGTDINGITIPIVDYDERIDNMSYPISRQKFTYNASTMSLHPMTNNMILGTERSILSFIPQSPYGIHSIERFEVVEGYDDMTGKPIRFSIEIDSSLRTQINQISFHWRPIHSYLS